MIYEDEFITEETPSAYSNNEQNDWSDYQTLQTIESTEPRLLSSPEIEMDYIDTAAKVKELLNGKDAFLMGNAPSMQVKHKKELTSSGAD